MLLLSNQGLAVVNVYAILVFQSSSEVLEWGSYSYECPLVKLGSALEFWEFFVVPYWFSTPCIAFTSRFRVSGFPKSSLRWLLMKGSILFCGYHLLQRTWLLGLFFSPCSKGLSASYAPLLRFWSLQWLGYQEPVFPRFTYLALSTLALSHRFSGFLFLVPLGFISPRNTLGIFLQSFLL